MEELLRVEALRKSYSSGFRRSSRVSAVDNVSLSVRRGETLGVVGESGCGKTSLARCIMLLERFDAGRILFDGADIRHVRGQQLRALRARLQMVFQHPDTALNPRLTIRTLIAEPMRLLLAASEDQIRHTVSELVEQVGLPEDVLERYPHELSGGQKQRVGIIRALATRPSLIILDEPTSALDVSVRAEVLQLLRNLQGTNGNTYLCISHDFTTVRFLADRVAVMYMGRIVEVGSADQIFTNPQHPYTQALLAAVPQPDPTRRDGGGIRLRGDVQGGTATSLGCKLAPRCPLASVRCTQETPVLYSISDGHQAACFLVDQEIPSDDPHAHVRAVAG